MHHHRKCRYSPGISRVSYTCHTCHTCHICDARDVVTYWQCPPRPPPRRRTRWTAHPGSDGPATPACPLASSPPPHARWTGRLVDWCPPLSLSSATKPCNTAWGRVPGWVCKNINARSLALALLLTQNLPQTLPCATDTVSSTAMSNRDRWGGGAPQLGDGNGCMSEGLTCSLRNACGHQPHTRTP